MTTTTERSDTWEMVLVHRTFRREFRMLPALIRAARTRDRAEVVGTHLHHLTGALHNHHTHEDDHLWPMLLSRVGLREDLVHRMESQHAHLATLLDRIDELNPRWRATADPAVRDELAEVVAGVSAGLDEHLADEENEILPLVQQYVTQAEWEHFNTQAQKSLPKNKLALYFVGAILEEADASETRRFLASLPAPARLLWRAFGPRFYAKEIGRVRRSAG
jgi:iron-sulfur cluster repair protein YtfE (RIC family)